MKHEIRREKGTTGNYLGGWIQVKCSCGWVAPKRYETASLQMATVNDDIVGHLKTQRKQ